MILIICSWAGHVPSDFSFLIENEGWISLHYQHVAFKMNESRIISGSQY